MTARLTFHGGVGTVTGANFLLDTGSRKILVDCGILQQEYPYGTKAAGACDTTNLEPFPYDPRTIDALLVTHAHADHIGRIPKLVRDGFRGVIYSTGATKDLAALMFDDALGIMDAHAKRHGCDYLYEAADVDHALHLWQTRAYHEPFDIGDVSVTLFDAGHILGSSIVQLARNQRSILFTGDLGNTPEPLLRDTEYPEGAQYLVMESVYGDRIHEGREERKLHLKSAIEGIQALNGTLLIPSFSIERTQILLYELNSMVEEHMIRPIPVYLDSPLATRVTEVFRTYVGLFNDAARERFTSGDDAFAFSGLTVIKNIGESSAIHTADDPKIIIAGAGMSGGGRIRAHEKFYLPEKRAMLLFIGYQAPGTLGRRIQDGAKKIQIDGEHVKIHARVETLTGYSGHADRDQLMDFVERTGEKLEKAFVVMGEPRSSIFFAQRVKDFLGIDALVPEKDESHELNF